jgi:hypothetical protein
MEDAAEHAAADEAEHAAKGGVSVATGEGPSDSMEMVREIEKGEKLGGVLEEAKTGMYETGREHAVVTLANGQRALVRGGRYGINFGAGSIKRILFHTHPWDDLARGASDADFKALEALGQASSHLYEHGSWTKFWNYAMFQ